MKVPAVAIPVGQPCGDLGGRVGGEVVQDHMNRQSSVHGRVDLFEELQHVATGVAFARSVKTCPVAMFIAANRSMVPLRL